MSIYADLIKACEQMERDADDADYAIVRVISNSIRNALAPAKGKPVEAPGEGDFAAYKAHRDQAENDAKEHSYKLGYKAGWNDRESDFICAVDRIAPPPEPVDDSLTGTADDQLWAGTPTSALRDAADALGVSEPVEGEEPAWKPIESAPRDGTPFWAYLYQSGIRLLFWITAEQIAQEEGGDPDDWNPSWVETTDHSEAWEPAYWLPFEAIPAPPEGEAER